MTDTEFIAEHNDVERADEDNIDNLMNDIRCY